MPSRLPGLAAAYLLLAAPLLLMLAVLIPPGQAPDEADHAVRAESLTRGAILGMRGQGVGMGGAVGTVSGVWADYSIALAEMALLPGEPKVMTRAALDRLRAVNWSWPTFSEATVAPYFPIFYVPQAVAIGAARAVGLRPLPAIYAGRLADALTTLALGGLALRLARRGHALLFAALSLPLSLWLAASLNQDGPMIAAACLAAALLTRAEDTAWARPAAAAVLACVLATKQPYVPLAAMLLLPIRGTRPAALAGRLALAAAAALPALVWTALILRYVSAPLPMAPYPAGPLAAAPGTMLTAADPAAQVHTLLDPVTRLFTVIAASALQQLPEKLQQMVGGLGTLSVSPPWPVTAAWLLALAAAAWASVFAGARQRTERERKDGWGALLAAMALLLCAALVYVALYLAWTPVGWEAVTGVQGRYYTPLLPFLMFVLPRGASRPGLRRALAAPAVALAAAGVVYLPLLTVGWFYFR